jgi:hypothetical protein
MRAGDQAADLAFSIFAQLPRASRFHSRRFSPG